MPQLILASSSIYRRELLERLKIPFATFSPNIDESLKPDESLEEHVLRLSQEKAIAAASNFPQSIIIGSDEVAALNNTLLGKPMTHENAIKQLEQMSGQRVFFHTGVCVHNPETNATEVRLVTTAVKFRPLSTLMIENYLNKEKPYHSAGSFKSETLGSALIERFEGEDPTAMIGLPLISLCDMLKKVGLDVI